MLNSNRAWKEFHPFQILPYLYCGDAEAAQNYRVLDTLGIECIISCKRSFYVSHQAVSLMRLGMVNAAMYVDNYAPACYKYLRYSIINLSIAEL